MQTAAAKCAGSGLRSRRTVWRYSADIIAKNAMVCNVVSVSVLVQAVVPSLGFGLRSALTLGTGVIGVYCGGTGDVDHTFFWLAKVQAKSRADAAIGDSPVFFKAAVRDEGWDIGASEFVLNIQWL
jgi:hypothetical protein